MFRVRPRFLWNWRLARVSPQHPRNQCRAFAKIAADHRRQTQVVGNQPHMMLVVAFLGRCSATRTRVRPQSHHPSTRNRGRACCRTWCERLKPAVLGRRRDRDIQKQPRSRLAGARSWPASAALRPHRRGLLNRGGLRRPAEKTPRQTQIRRAGAPLPRGEPKREDASPARPRVKLQRVKRAKQVCLTLSTRGRAQQLLPPPVRTHLHPANDAQPDPRLNAARKYWAQTTMLSRDAGAPRRRAATTQKSSETAGGKRYLHRGHPLATVINTLPRSSAGSATDTAIQIKARASLHVDSINRARRVQELLSLRPLCRQYSSANTRRCRALIDGARPVGRASCHD